MQIDKKGFTKRETRMLVLLLVVGVTAALVMLVIIPTFNQLQDDRDEYHRLTIERANVQSMLLSEPVIRENHEQALQMHDELAARFFDDAHSSEIGRMLAQLCEDHNLSPLDQRIQNPVELEPGGAFLVVTASMTVSGMYANLKRLIDTVEERDYLRLSRVSFNLRDDSDWLDRVVLVFEVVMIRG